MQNLSFDRPGRFYKGNLHTHSTNSDGDHAPDRVCAAYRDASYDFLALSDHFRECFDFPVSDTRGCRTRDFTTVISAELHAPRTEVGEIWHVHGIGLPLNFEPNLPDETGPELGQRAFEAGAFVGIVHPAWYGLTHEDARQIPNAHAIEIYNHGSHVEVDRGNDWPFLDKFLNDGWRLTGYAADDAHQLTHDWLGGWVMVHAEELDPDALVDSLKAGRYYSSQGPEIHGIDVDDVGVTIRCSPARTIAIQGRGSKSEMVMGDGMERATLPLKRIKDSWFRVTVTDAEGKRAWSNPIWRD